MLKKLFIASGNTHKVEEFGSLLDGFGFEVFSAKACGGMPEVDENGDSFSANARLKAIALKSTVPEGACVLADDSGLEVDALDGAPGIYSARYAGVHASDTENLDKLLTDLSGIAEHKRSARFRCLLCFIDEDGREQFFDGSCEGRIALTPSGIEGFGYDPAFVPDGYEETFGQLGKSVKSQLSHRARAVQAFRSGICGESVNS